MAICTLVVAREASISAPSALAKSPAVHPPALYSMPLSAPLVQPPATYSSRVSVQLAPSAQSHVLIAVHSSATHEGGLAQHKTSPAHNQRDSHAPYHCVLVYPA